ncbi:hypothetical protein N0V82_006493 [Gnomoniopsis sp. IMI 355080]|nr:hypothetical protein N0V82_006493 [Gnomoniopsis sp. IMI 355080]
MSLIDVPPSYASSVRRSKSVGSSRHKPKQRKYVPDPIDKLDSTSFGGFYHHGGPYDAARPSFNINPKFSPIAATKEGNKAAWDATPREAQLDALLKGRPLDGVSFVPPGHRAMNGQLMEYEEGSDMMRECDPMGGAYKQWAHIKYHPDDLKGKGEPGFTIDRERKAAEAAAGTRGRSKSVQASREEDRAGVYEMRPQASRRRRDFSQSSTAKGGENPVLVRQRSSSASEVVASSSGSRPSATLLKEGLKRRFGSLKRK